MTPDPTAIPVQREAPAPLRVAEGFAGAGLAALGLRERFRCVWANDSSPQKAAIYHANFPETPFEQRPIEEIQGSALPAADLAWASFPCQDLSLAGTRAGLTGARSGLVWEWLRVLDGMAPPPAVVLENVGGLVSGRGGEGLRQIAAALHERGFLVGAVELDAAEWLPQSRRRVFVIGLRHAPPSNLVADDPGFGATPALRAAALEGALPGWRWWRFERPNGPHPTLESLIEWDAPVDPPHETASRLALLSPRMQRLLSTAITRGQRVFPGFRRTRPTGQQLELRFDGLTGCLRTPRGGSSRQLVVLAGPDGELGSRLLTPREAARLMGAPDSFILPTNANAAYQALGDGVAVPVAAAIADWVARALR